MGWEAGRIVVGERAMLSLCRWVVRILLNGPIEAERGDELGLGRIEHKGPIEAEPELG